MSERGLGSPQPDTTASRVAQLQDAMREQGRCPECGWRTGDGSVCSSCYRTLLKGARDDR